MDIHAILAERREWLERKDIRSMRELLGMLPDINPSILEWSDAVTIGSESDGSYQERQQILESAKALKPWRKGPFEIFGTKIDSEWDSSIKYNAIIDALDVDGKSVIDVGCNNGYYLFRLLEKQPQRLVGFDPSTFYKTQFDFLNHFAKTDILFELLGIEHLPYYPEKFDVALCLGVIYHRTDPITALKQLSQGIKKGGTAIIDCLIIDGEEEVALIPKERYAMMKNVYYVPTIPALQNWMHRARLETESIIDIIPTTLDEQRKTEWIDGNSLDDFVDFDKNQTAEGYPLPKRAYIKAKKL